MFDSRDVDLLKKSGYEFLHCDNPEIWGWLEGRFSERRIVGSNFSDMPSEFVSELLSAGEEILLNDMSESLRKTGGIEKVTHVIDFPYSIGTEAVKRVGEVDKSKILRLVQFAGEYGERVVQVLPTLPADMPLTNKVTIEGGVYADGHTVGYLGISPGDIEHNGKGGDDEHVFLATPDDIRALIREMKAAIENGMLSRVSEKDCREMIEKAEAGLC